MTPENLEWYKAVSQKAKMPLWLLGYMDVYPAQLLKLEDMGFTADEAVVWADAWVELAEVMGDWSAGTTSDMQCETMYRSRHVIGWLFHLKKMQGRDNHPVPPPRTLELCDIMQKVSAVALQRKFNCTGDELHAKVATILADQHLEAVAKHASHTTNPKDRN